MQLVETFERLKPHTGDALEALPTIDELNEKIDAENSKQVRSVSNDAWWEHQATVSYLMAVRGLLEAAEIAGRENLPDVHIPEPANGIKESCSKLEEFGKLIVMRAEAAA